MALLVTQAPKTILLPQTMRKSKSIVVAIKSNSLIEYDVEVGRPNDYLISYMQLVKESKVLNKGTDQSNTLIRCSAGEQVDWHRHAE